MRPDSLIASICLIQGVEIWIKLWSIFMWKCSNKNIIKIWGNTLKQWSSWLMPWKNRELFFLPTPNTISPFNTFLGTRIFPIIWLVSILKTWSWLLCLTWPPPWPLFRPETAQLLSMPLKWWGEGQESLVFSPWPLKSLEWNSQELSIRVSRFPLVLLFLGLSSISW